MDKPFLVIGIVGILVGLWYLLAHNPININIVLWVVLWGIIAWIGFHNNP